MTCGAVVWWGVLGCEETNQQQHHRLIDSTTTLEPKERLRWHERWRSTHPSRISTLGGADDEASWIGSRAIGDEQKSRDCFSLAQNHVPGVIG